MNCLTLYISYLLLSFWLKWWNVLIGFFYKEFSQLLALWHFWLLFKCFLNVFWMFLECLFLNVFWFLTVFEKHRFNKLLNARQLFLVAFYKLNFKLKENKVSYAFSCIFCTHLKYVLFSNKNLFIEWLIFIIDCTIINIWKHNDANKNTNKTSL